MLGTSFIGTHYIVQCIGLEFCLTSTASTMFTALKSILNTWLEFSLLGYLPRGHEWLWRQKSLLPKRLWGSGVRRAAAWRSACDQSHLQLAVFIAKRLGHLVCQTGCTCSTSSNCNWCRSCSRRLGLEDCLTTILRVASRHCSRVDEAVGHEWTWLRSTKRCFSSLIHWWFIGFCSQSQWVRVE